MNRLIKDICSSDKAEDRAACYAATSTHHSQEKAWLAGYEAAMAKNDILKNRIFQAELLLRLADEIQCKCSIKERMSGHLVGCDSVDYLAERESYLQTYADLNFDESPNKEPK
jgi:hypothetical protein